MSVYAGDNASFFARAVESVAIDQMLLPKEIVIVIDGPVSADITDIIEQIRSRANMPFTIIKEPHNKGLASALNLGLAHCNYEWVARMDADDISLPVRFLEADTFIKQNQETDIFGSQIAEIQADSEHQPLGQGKIRRVPLTHEAIQKYYKFRNPLNHPSVFFRAQIVRDIGSYPLEYPEDYFLWAKMLRAGYRFANIPKTLVHMRINDDFYKRRGLHMLKGEVKLYQSLWHNGEISLLTFLAYSGVRIAARLGGKFTAKLIYRLSRH